MYKYEYQYSNNLIPDEWAWKKNTDNINYPNPETAVLYRHCRTLNEDNQIIEESINSVLNLYSIGKDSGHLIESPNTPLNIYKQPKGQIKLLMIGSSFCYYYVEELRALAEEYGIDLVIANLYSSGHTIQQYANEANGTTTYSKHSLYITDSNGRNHVDEKGTWSLEGALKEKEWDIISLQNYYNTKKGFYDNQYEDDEKSAKIVYDYCKQICPKARYLWNQTWAHDIGFADRFGRYFTKEEQTKAFQNIALCADAVKNTCGVEIVPSGTAWQFARQSDKITTINQQNILQVPIYGFDLDPNQTITEYGTVKSITIAENYVEFTINTENGFPRKVSVEKEYYNGTNIKPVEKDTVKLYLTTQAEKAYMEYVEGLGEWGLCVRLNSSKEPYTDHFHDGDVGGGQYLNACVWFMTLFKISCVGSKWAPSYDLNEEKRIILQQAAFNAVTTN